MEGFEEVVIGAISWGRLGIEILGALVVMVGVIVSVTRIGHSGHKTTVAGAEARHDFRHVRLTLSQYLVVALELQLAADILATTVAPSWMEIGKLAAVATIRTSLNYFLEREMREMEEQGESVPRHPFASDSLTPTRPTPG